MTSTAVAGEAIDDRAVGSFGEILRDISRGGLAGALVGIVVCGLGGRIVMRLASIVVPTSAGSFTENGNRIGDITLSGSLGLILFGGLFFGTLAGTIWVVVSLWIPGTGLLRAFLSIPVAVALTGIALISGSNPDFRILQHDVLVVAMLLTLVGLAGLSIALVDDWLDGRLPLPGTSRSADAIYVVLTLSGGLLILPVVVQAYLADRTALGLALIGVGLATLAWWWIRRKGRERIPIALLVAGRATLAVAVVLGFLELAPEVAMAIGA